MTNIYFDGYCSLCLRSTQFIEKWKAGPHFNYLSQASPEGQKFFSSQKLPNISGASLWIEADGLVFNKSKAALHIAKYLRPPFRYLTIFSFLPLSINDCLYDLVANNRYRIFGKIQHE